MSIIEFQVKAATFLAAQRNVLRSLPLCTPTLPAVSGVQVVIDRIEFGSSALRHDKPAEFPTFYSAGGERVPTPNRATGFQTQLVQEVTVHLTTMGAILARPNQPPAVVVPLTARIVYDLDLYCTDDGEAYLTARLATADAVELLPTPSLPPDFDPLNALPKDLQDQIRTFLAQQARLFGPSMTLPLGISNLPLLGKVGNAGLSVDSGLQRLALRLQIGGMHMNVDVPWSNFFQGFIPDRLQGSDWGLFVEAGLLTETMKAVVYQHLPKDDNLEAYPGCTYASVGGKAVLTLDALVIYHLYKNQYLGVDISVSAQPKVSLELTCDTPGWLTLDFEYEHLLNSDDPLVAVAKGLVHLFGIPVEAMVYALVGSTVVKELSGQPIEIVKQISPTRVRCEKLVRVPQVPGTKGNWLSAVLAQPDGVCLAGTLKVVELTSAVLTITAGAFKVEAPSISCSTANMALVAAFLNNPSGFPVLHARGYIENQGTAPLSLCGPPVVLRGADGPFPQSGVRTDDTTAPITVLVDIPAPPASYAGDYPLDLLVRTTAGTRLLRIAPPPAVNSEDYSALGAELLAKVGSCQQLVDPWFGMRGYNPLWGPRPPEDGTYKQFWEVSIEGLRPGQAVALLDRDASPIATAVSVGRAVTLSALVAPEVGRGLTIQRVGAREVEQPEDGGEGPDRGRGIEVRQRNAVDLGAIALPAPCRGLAVATLLEVPCLIAVLEGSIAAYDFRVPARPSLVAAWSIEGVRGVLRWRDDLIAYGGDGFTRIDGSGRGASPIGSCGDGPVLDAAADRDSLYALNDRGLTVYSARFCRTGRVRLEGARSLARIDGRLVIGGRRGLVVATPGEGRRPALDASHEDGSFVTIRAGLQAEPGSFLALTEEGDTILFRLDDGGPEEVGSIPGRAWTLDTVRLGDVLVSPGPDGTHLDVRRLGESSVS
ncbi:MAG: hypothetical protein U0790_11230 [Isosphaeraceae bacterium]